MRIRAVIFDDDATLRQLLWTVCDNRGYEVSIFRDPSLCPLHAMSRCPCPADTVCADLILSDLNMLHVNGLDFIEGLRTKRCGVPHFILLSGAWSAAERERATRLGCQVLAKPFALPELVACLETVEATISPKRHLLDWGSQEWGVKHGTTGGS